MPTEERKEQGRQANRNWYERNKEAQRLRRRTYYQNNIERERQRNLNYRNTHIEKCRKANREWIFKKKRGITVTQRDEMLAAQGGRCKCCGTDNPGNKWGWQVDHCHQTGKIRGVLCHFCNVGIGHAKDNIETLKKWICYLGG